MMPEPVDRGSSPLCDWDPRTTPHPSAKAIDDMFEVSGGVWPPRPIFDGWPESWRPYQLIAEVMPRVCAGLNNTSDFRRWLEAQLKSKVSLDAVMDEVQAHMECKDSLLLGLLAPLSFMANFYRWGTIPPSEKERQRIVLTFPTELWTPFSTLCNYWGLAKRGTNWGFAVGNCLYPETDKESPPIAIRFSFTSEPDVFRTEQNFFLVFIHMDMAFNEALIAMKDYLLLTDRAKMSIHIASAVLDLRLKQLSTIKRGVRQMSDIFRKFMQDNVVSFTDWPKYIQAIRSWNINGIEGGSTGAETLAFNALDEFLILDGRCQIYQNTLRTREGLPLQCRKILDTLRQYGTEYRFCSFLGHTNGNDPVENARDEVIQSLYIWRLSHSKASGKYLVHSRMTSGGVVDKNSQHGESLAEVGMELLRERARETIGKCSTTMPK